MAAAISKFTWPAAATSPGILLTADLEVLTNGPSAAGTRQVGGV